MAPVLLRDLGVMPVDEFVRAVEPSLFLLLLLTSFVGGFLAVLIERLLFQVCMWLGARRKI